MNRTFDNSILVRVGRPDSIDQATLMDIWVGSYCKGDYSIVSDPTSDEIDVLFELTEDATIFKLMWI